MKKGFTLLLCLAFVLTVSSPVFAAEAQINFTSTAPVIDGEIDDVWKTANKYEMTNSLEVQAGVPIENDADLSGTWSALWDDNYFYILYEVNDDVRVRDSAHQGNHWDDSVELFIAPEGNEYSNYRWLIGEDYLDSYSGPNEWADIDFNEVEYVVVDHGEHYVVEAAIPWTNMHGIDGVSLGQQIRIDVHVNDDDGNAPDNMRESKIAWFGTEDNAWADVNNLGTAYLVDPSVPDSMPKTGMGGTSGGSMTTIMLLAIFASAIIGAWMLKSRSEKQM